MPFPASPICRLELGRRHMVADFELCDDMVPAEDLELEVGLLVELGG